MKEKKMKALHFSNNQGEKKRSRRKGQNRDEDEKGKDKNKKAVKGEKVLFFKVYKSFLFLLYIPLAVL